MAIDKNKEAMKLALEALEFDSHYGSGKQEAITALREALAEQPAQPYKGIADHTNQVTNGRMRIDPVTGDLGIGTPSPQPAQQEPLEYWNAVEGWVKVDEVQEHFDSVGCGTIYKSAGEGQVPLYTASPAQRTWVGLTDEEIESLDCVYLNWLDYEQVEIKGDKEFARAIEAKLKEKNT